MSLYRDNTVLASPKSYSRMATAYTPDTEHGDDNFILELNRVKEKVRTRFIELTECLSERESELMRELDEILSSYE